MLLFCCYCCFILLSFFFFFFFFFFLLCFVSFFFFNISITRQQNEILRIIKSERKMFLMSCGCIVVCLHFILFSPCFSCFKMGESLVKINNSIGPNIDPCGTPAFHCLLTVAEITVGNRSNFYSRLSVL